MNITTPTKVLNELVESSGGFESFYEILTIAMGELVCPDKEFVRDAIECHAHPAVTSLIVATIIYYTNLVASLDNIPEAMCVDKSRLQEFIDSQKEYTTPNEVLADLNILINGVPQ